MMSTSFSLNSSAQKQFIASSQLNNSAIDAQGFLSEWPQPILDEKEEEKKKEEEEKKEEEKKEEDKEEEKEGEEIRKRDATWDAFSNRLVTFTAPATSAAYKSNIRQFYRWFNRKYKTALVPTQEHCEEFVISRAKSGFGTAELVAALRYKFNYC